MRPRLYRYGPARGRWWAWVLMAWLAGGMSLRGVVILSDGDPDRNASAPSGELEGSGWQWQGMWGPFLGTAIGPHHFITARHVGGAPGDVFLFHGVGYRTRGLQTLPGTDLAIWEVEGALPDFAPLYRQSHEAGKRLVVFGRGTQRGAPVFVRRAVGPRLQGWKKGVADSVPRWGENVVTQVVDGDEVFQKLPEEVGELLRVSFDENGGPFEAHLTLGDSGGGVFIRSDGEWQLAGVNYAVDGPFSLDAAGEVFQAALFDMGGVYIGSEEHREPVPVREENQPSSFYATRISQHVAWIDSVVTRAAGPISLLVSKSVSGPYKKTDGFLMDAAARTIRIPITSAAAFFRVQGTGAGQGLRLRLVGVEGRRLVLGY